VWQYGIKSKKLEVLVKHDPALYDPDLNVSAAPGCLF
jgi:hypothetical protein